MIAREAVALAAGLGGSVKSAWDASVAAFLNESLADIALKSMQGLPIEAAAVTGVRLLKTADGIADAAKETTLLLNGPIRMTEKGMAHVVERHTVNDIAKFADKSKFNEAENLSTLISSGTHQQMVQQANGNFARTWDAGRSIGIDRVTGQQTSVMTVITRPNGELVTAFPGRP
ncbi:hypothetical protein GCM10023165_35770 [Variovorax defluvii]|uniref:Bacterial EndoU nuclease domain-containing protein n=1 Tax=Variovorax defluvii TaxID=913761 RepID=A0ABP8I157_9BURK